MATGLYIASYFKPRLGGGIEYTHQIANHLTELGEHITVLTPPQPGDAEFDKTCDYAIVRPDSNPGSGGGWKHPLNRIRFLIETVKAARRVDVDYLIYDGHSLVPTASVLLASKLTRRPLFVVSHHLTDLADPPWYERFLHNRTLRAASMNVCVSNYTSREVLDRGVDPSRICVIPNGVDFQQIESFQSCSGNYPRVDAGFPTRGPVLLSVSRLVMPKGIHRVIEAMPRILSEVPGTQYVIVGDGQYREHLMRLATASPARDSITFLGALTDEEKFECYNRCDVFALPSEVEGFGVVFLEANAFGKPVVGGRIGGVPEAVVHGETGLLVNPHNVGDISEAVIRLLKHPEEAAKLGENGRHRVRNQFGWKASASKLLSVIRDVLEERQ